MFSHRAFKLKNKSGFTFVELIIATTLLLIAATAFIPAFIMVSKSNTSTKINITATGVATSILEQITAMNYDDIGTQGGNPTGNVVQVQTKTIDGITYHIDSLISWQEATGSSNAANVVAYKNIRVIVSAVNPFSNVLEKRSELTSVVSREGETVLVQAGHLKFTILGVDNNPIDTSTFINIAGGTTDQTLETDYAGEALFGIIPHNTYVGKIQRPSGYLAPQNEPVDGSNNILRNNIVVEDWKVSDEQLRMDRSSRFCDLSIKLVDATSGSVILPACTYANSWSFESKTNNFGNKPLTINSYGNDDCISDSIVGKLCQLEIIL